MDDEGNPIETINASGMVARVSTKMEYIGSINGTPLVRTVYGDVEGLPESKPGILYLVSSMVLGYVHNRNDIYAPANFVKDDYGKIIGARAVTN